MARLFAVHKCIDFSIFLIFLMVFPVVAKATTKEPFKGEMICIRNVQKAVQGDELTEKAIREQLVAIYGSRANVEQTASPFHDLKKEVLHSEIGSEKTQRRAVGALRSFEKALQEEKPTDNVNIQPLVSWIRTSESLSADFQVIYDSDDNRFLYFVSPSYQGYKVKAFDETLTDGDSAVFNFELNDVDSGLSSYIRTTIHVGPLGIIDSETFTDRKRTDVDYTEVHSQPLTNDEEIAKLRQLLRQRIVNWVIVDVDNEYGKKARLQSILKNCFETGVLTREVYQEGLERIGFQLK